MKRLWIVLVAGVVIELSRGYFIPRLEALPAKPDGWTLVTQTAFDPVPAELKTEAETSRAVKAWRATYNGPSLITITLYAMPWSPGSAWDAIQKWRPASGTMAFAKGRFFGVAVSPGADQATLKQFLQSITATLPPGAETIR